MKGIPIKFRGVDYITNKVLFGDLIHYSGCPFIRTSEFNQFLNKAEYAVEPETLAQLVGYDVDGNEVYEGDKLISDGGIEFVAELWAMGVNSLDADSLQGGIFNFKLKEKTDE